MSCHFQDYLQAPQVLCIQQDLSQISFQDFWQDVMAQRQRIADLEATQWALWENDSYAFLLLFFAGLLAGKQMLLAPNRVKDTEVELAEQGIHFITRQAIAWPIDEGTHAESQSQSAVDLHDSTLFNDDFLNQAQVFFYTSGSTGQPKKIPHTLRQLLNEVQGLNQSFNWTEPSTAVATVSHQHIYGLLFKLLLPLATGRSFYNSQLPFPEHVAEVQHKLAAIQQHSYVVSSPALLKRWTTDVQLLEDSVVFSSGGKLEAGVRSLVNRPIIEVLGSSETGGIAHRAEDDALWTPFANVEIQITAQEELGVRTNHACTEAWIFTGDRAQLIDSASSEAALRSQFRLLGRLDRLVKLEEKRLSLDAIEHKMMTLPYVEQCHVLLIEHEQRQMLVCVAVLTESAKQQLIQDGKAVFVKQLKADLQDKLETIAIPRQWRFLSALPQNSQSKLNKNELKSLFTAQNLPVVIQQHIDTEQAAYQLDFIPELACFKGHFPNYPIYPGVGQIAFIQHFAKQCWSDLQWCNGYEQLKFQDLIRPYAAVQLNLQRKQHKIHFEMHSQGQMLASGRLLFALDTVLDG